MAEVETGPLVEGAGMATVCCLLYSLIKMGIDVGGINPLSVAITETLHRGVRSYLQAYNHIITLKPKCIHQKYTQYSRCINTNTNTHLRLITE